MGKLKQQFIDNAYEAAQKMGLDDDEADQYVKDSLESLTARGSVILGSPDHKEWEIVKGGKV
jgi:hypothetical protein